MKNKGRKEGRKDAMRSEEGRWVRRSITTAMTMLVVGMTIPLSGNAGSVVEGGLTVAAMVCAAACCVLALMTEKNNHEAREQLEEGEAGKRGEGEREHKPFTDEWGNVHMPHYIATQGSDPGHGEGRRRTRQGYLPRIRRVARMDAAGVGGSARSGAASVGERRESGEGLGWCDEHATGSSSSVERAWLPQQRPQEQCRRSRRLQ